MLKPCTRCNGNGSYMDDVPYYHNEHSWERVTCRACSGTGKRDLEAEALKAAQDELEYAGKAHAEAHSELRKATKRLSAAERSLTKLQRKAS